MSRGCNGIVYEPYDARLERYQAADLIGLDLGSPSLPLADHVFVPPTGWADQGGTESCVGWAIAQAIYIRQGALGIPPHKRVAPSPTDIYYRARASRHGWQDIVDIGSNPVAGWEVLRAAGTPDGMGIVAYDDLPFSERTIDSPPAPHCYQRSVDHDWLSYHWVLDEGQSRLVELDALLACGRPVACAITCDTPVLTWKPSDGPWRYRGPRRGGHYICLISSTPDAYWAVGSWGSGYGLGGLHQIARDEIASPRCSYFSTPDIDVSRIL